MKIRKILPILILALLVSATADAQRRRTKKKKVEEVEETVQQKLYKTMLPSTQKIMFIDSIDATRDDYLKYIKLPHDIGSILKYSEFFNMNDTARCTGFVNGFGNAYYFSIPTDSGLKLHSAEKLGDQWRNEREIKELNEFASDTYSPYLMTDGITLYFAAKSETESLGGFDIFVTRYDAETGTFLEPQNIGMPFNSPANDYMFVVDDLNKIGWFVTDRNKKDGHVTVYTFVPSDVRTNYDIEQLGEEKVKSLAQISSYKETWTSKADRDKIMKRLNVLANKNAKNSSEFSYELAINNSTVYNNAEDFKSEEAAEMYQKLIQMEKDMAGIDRELDRDRIKYHVSPESTRSKMAPDILNKERAYEVMKAKAKDLRKQIINKENETLKTK